MDAGKRQFVGESAMAGNVHAVAHLFHLNVMSVEYFRKFSSDRFQSVFQLRITLNARSWFNCGRFAFDVGEDRCNFGILPSDLGLHVGYAIMRLLQRKLLIHLEVLFYMQPAVQILHADIVNIQIVPGSNRAHPIKYIFSDCGSRN